MSFAEVSAVGRIAMRFLPLSVGKRAQQLEHALDHIRQRYGSKAVIPANLIKNDLGIRDSGE